MPSPHLEVANPAPLIIGVGAILHSAFQPTMIVCFMCAVLGAGIGLAFLPAPKETLTRNELLWKFVGNASYIIAISIVAMFGMSYMPQWVISAEYAASFFFSMGLMLYRDLIIQKVGSLFGRKLDGV